MRAMTLTAPQALRPGDTVAVVAPAGPLQPARLREGLGRLAQRYRVRCDPGLVRRQGYLAGSDEQRAESLNRALADPQVRGIFCGRGGFGVTRILPLLDGSALRDDPRPLVGFSDITALHAWANVQGVVGMHGPVVTQLGRLPGADLIHLFAVLEQRGATLTLTGRSLGRGSIGHPPVRAPLVGGNLSMLGALAGTPWQPPLRHRILLVEEVSEASYRMDRVVTQLRAQPPGFAATELAAVGVGDLAGCADAPGRPAALSVLVSELADGRPALVGLPFGHGARNRAWPVGLDAELDPARGELRFRGAVQ